MRPSKKFTSEEKGVTKAKIEIYIAEPKAGCKHEIMHGMLRFFVLLITMTLVLSVTAMDSNDLPRRQTVAVVLSGGGAKGVAHVGVLRALEENNVPIDYIAGTSMGAIVGGLYAAGYSPDEIEELITSQEFLDASVGKMDKNYRFRLYEPDPSPAWVTLKFRPEQLAQFHEIIRENIPTNMVSPGVMDFLFMKYLQPASAAAGNNFDNLFVPFRCIASDITDKEAVVLRNGSLAEAVRASMTFPLYFKPIIIDGKVMFDGGMYNNFPADVVYEEFQPDFIIGSVVATNPKDPCIHDLYSQLENIFMTTSTYLLPGGNGVILYPDVPDLSVTDFSRSDELFIAGYEEALDKMGFIKAMVPNNRFRQEVQYKRFIFRQKFPGELVSDIKTLSGDEATGDFVRSFLMTEENEISFETLRENYFRLLSVDKFNHIYPRLFFDPLNETYELQLELRRNNPLTRRIGGNLSSRSINQLYIHGAYERLGKRLFTAYSNIYIGNLYNSGNLGVRLNFFKAIPYYLQIETSISRWNYTTESVFFFEEQKPSFIVQQEFLNDFRIVFPARYKGIIQAGAFTSRHIDRYYNTSVFSRTDTTDETRLQPSGLYIKFERSSRDRFQFPRSGSFFQATARYIAAREEYTPGTTSFNPFSSTQSHNWWEINLQTENFLTARRSFRLAVSSELFLSNRPLLVNYSASKIMAKQFSPFPLATTKYLDAFRANHFIAGGLKALYLLNRNAHLQVESHVFRATREIIPGPNHGADYKDWLAKPVFMHNAAFVYHTMAGPVSLSASYFQGESDPWVFMFNFGYILFNRRTF